MNCPLCPTINSTAGTIPICQCVCHQPITGNETAHYTLTASMRRALYLCEPCEGSGLYPTHIPNDVPYYKHTCTTCKGKGWTV